MQSGAYLNIAFRKTPSPEFGIVWGLVWANDCGTEKKAAMQQQNEIKTNK